MQDQNRLFAYGSLMWDPGFPVAEMTPARLEGYARSFCLLSVVYRGTVEAPGLVLGLDAHPGAHCIGLALRVAEPDWPEALAGATPYQRLFGLVLTGAYLAKGALADGGDGRNAERAALCRFAAENIIGETAALRDRVISGAGSLEAARVVLG